MAWGTRLVSRSGWYGAGEGEKSRNMISDERDGAQLVLSACYAEVGEK